MRTNINLVKSLAKEPVKLYGHVFTKGEPIVYHHRHHVPNDYPILKEAHGVYLSHRSFSRWHNGIEHHNCSHLITIINKDGKQDTVSWVKPVSDK